MQCARTTIVNSRGFSIIEVLVVVGIMSVISLGLMTLISNQRSEIQAIDEKMAVQSIQVQLRNVLSSTPFCGCFIGAHTFNYSTLTWNTFPTSVASSYDSTCTPIGAAFLNVGSNVSPKLLTTSMSLQNVTETITGSGNFTANLTVEFDQNLLKRSLKPVSVPMYFTINMTDPIAARRLSSCFSVAPASAVDLSTLCGDIGGVYNAAVTPPCQPTYQ